MFFCRGKRGSRDPPKSSPKHWVSTVRRVFAVQGRSGIHSPRLYPAQHRFALLCGCCWARNVGKFRFHLLLVQVQGLSLVLGALVLVPCLTNKISSECLKTPVLKYTRHESEPCDLTPALRLEAQHPLVFGGSKLFARWC